MCPWTRRKDKTPLRSYARRGFAWWHKLRLAVSGCKLEARASMEETRPNGVERADVIDFFAHDTKTDQVLLVMFESRSWDDSELQLFQVQEKFNAYVSFLLDGELAEAHPELADKNARIELRCADMPKGRALDLLNSIH